MRVRVLEVAYVAGARFVAALHGAGGFALVNRVYEHPPESTEQVLHPEKYVAGESPVRVAAPTPPAGWTPVEVGTLGELGVDALLGRCLPLDEAHRAATDWGGDTYLVAKGPSGVLGLLWATVWDDEAAAERFEAALHKLADSPCWLREGPWRLPEPIGIAREGTRVVAVRGLKGAEQPAAVAALLKLAGDRPPARPPVGDVTIVMPAEPAATPRLHRVQGTFTSERLGLTAEFPARSLSTSDPATGALEISDRGHAGLTFRRRAFADNEAVFAEALGAMQKQKFGPVEDPRGGELATPLGPAVQRTWRIATDGTARIRVILIGICDGAATLVVREMWGNDADRETLERWFGSLKPAGAAPAPVCSEK